MSNDTRLSATEAFVQAVPSGGKIPVGKSSSFVCPYPDCRTFAQHHWGWVSQVAVLVGNGLSSSRPTNTSPELCLARCEACTKEVIFLGGALIWPLASTAPPPGADLPPAILRDYQEAAAICSASPRGAAALLRLAIQKLCLELGSSEKDINKAIGAFVADGRISPAIQQALDAVRVIGNEAVHPGSMDLRDDTATVTSLFHLVNFIVEKMISDPKEIETIYQGLPADKLAGIVQRDSVADKKDGR